MSTQRNQIRSTKNFIWYLRDVLGNGATSTVYLGRFKKNGDKVAVKVFNNLSFMRPSQVQQREFDVLLKLKHENIVRLIDIEEDQVHKQPVLVMELCTGGSLYSMLEEPEHSYGLKEIEFLRVIGNITAGMQHLRENDIIHRDIKPGNIMRVRADDGSYIYKLADFGAARELQDDQPYASLYGTEEYLHPDLYQRAVLKQPTNQIFTARTDLWSTGVTIYHVATGVLPFRPYGGRRNKDIMHHITTQKESGVISAVQRESPGGAIEWSKELPKHCHLSLGLKLIITGMLAGLMECDPSKMWTFDRFFKFVQRLLDMVVIHMFEPGSSEMYRIYVEKTWTLAEFREQVTSQTAIQDIHQAFYFENEVFNPEPSLPCSQYPETSEDNPLICMDVNGSGKQIFIPSQPVTRKTATHYSLENDVALAKMYTAVLYFGQEVLRKTMIKQHLFSKTVKTLRTILKTKYCHLERKVLEIRSKLDAAEAFCKTMVSKSSTSVHLYVDEMNDDAICRCHSSLKDLMSTLEEKMKSINELRMAYNNIQHTMDGLKDPVLNSDELTRSWEMKTKNCKPCTVCAGKFQVYVSDAMTIYLQFRKDRQTKQLSYNEEQIHKMDKDKLGTKCEAATCMYQTDCDDKWKKIHKHFHEWFGDANVFFYQINELEDGFQSLTKSIEELQSALNKMSSDVDEKTENYRVMMKSYLLSVINFASKSQKSLGHPQMPPAAATDTISIPAQETNPQVPSDSMHTYSEESPSDPKRIVDNMSFIQTMLRNLPQGTIRVPKKLGLLLMQLDEGLESGTREFDQTKKILTDYQQLSQRERRVREGHVGKD